MTKKNIIEQLLEKAWKLRGEGNYDESIKVLSSAESLCELDDYYFLGRINHIRMQYEADKENYERAIEFCRLAISLYRKSKDLNKIAHSMRHLADLQLEINQLNDAEKNYMGTINIYKNINANSSDFANALRGYALLLEKQNKISRAIDLWGEIVQLYKENNFNKGVQEGINKMNYLYDKQK